MTGRHRFEIPTGVPSAAILARLRADGDSELVVTATVFDGDRRLGAATGPLTGLTVAVEPGTATHVVVHTGEAVLYEGPIRAQEYTRDGTWTLQGAIVPEENLATPLRGEDSPPGPPPAPAGPNHTAHSEAR